MEENQFFVRFWGVRGSVACPGSKTVCYGGNTACVEIRCGEHLLIFDAGTGIYLLGKHLLTQGPCFADLFITHTHLDHVSGFPFFKPAYQEQNRFTIWGNSNHPLASIKTSFQSLMQTPLFPVPLEFMRADLRFINFEAGEVLPLAPAIQVRTAALNHPGGATGYRVDYQGKSICYVTDTEHEPGRLDARILELIENTDIIIYDAMYTDAEYLTYRGWGHSTWQEGVKLARVTGARTFVAFHHSPDHDDDDLDQIAAELFQVPETRSIVAREGSTLYLNGQQTVP